MVTASRNSSVRISSCSIAGCSAGARGGVAFSDSSSLSFTGCAISSCSAGQSGGVAAGVWTLNGESQETSFSNCIISGCSANGDGGVAHVRDAYSTLIFSGCDIFSCLAGRNGGVALGESFPAMRFASCNVSDCAASKAGGCCYLSSGQLRVKLTIVSGCRAEEGGALYVVTGTVALSNATLFRDNAALMKGSSSFIASGTVTYELPAPAGHWLPNAVCEVYREDCPLFTGSLDSTIYRDTPHPWCMSLLDVCRGREDVNGTPPLVDGALGTPPFAGSWQCTQSLTRTQPCDWLTNPELLGRRIYRLLPGAEEQNFPYACSPGLAPQYSHRVSAVTHEAFAVLSLSCTAPRRWRATALLASSTTVASSATVPA